MLSTKLSKKQRDLLHGGKPPWLSDEDWVAYVRIVKNKTHPALQELKKPVMVKVPKEVLENMRTIGRQMSNVCFNFSQKSSVLTEAERAMLRDLYRAWDNIPR